MGGEDVTRELLQMGADSTKAGTAKQPLHSTGCRSQEGRLSHPCTPLESSVCSSRRLWDFAWGG